MNLRNLMLSPNGTMQPRPFAFAVVALYGVNLLICGLVDPRFFPGGKLLFVIFQAGLTWCWFALHAKRLRDSGRGTTVAAFIAAAYMFVFVIVTLVAFGANPPPEAGQAGNTLISIFSALLFGALLSSSGFGGLGYFFLLVGAIPPLVVLLIFVYSAVVAMRSPVVE